jgi:hypothetical protein
MRYRAVDHAFWRELGDLYRFSESLRFAQANVVIHRGETTTARAEFLRAAMMAACSPDALMPAQIDILERILTRFAGDFQLSPPQAPELPYLVDLSGSSSPRRFDRRRKPTATNRRFGPGAAYERLREADDFMQRSMLVPTSLGLSDVMDTAAVHNTVRHLLQCWSPQLTPRHAPRRMHVERVAVVHEFDDVVANMAGLYRETHFVSNEEGWMLEDESPAGYAAFVRNPGGSWLTVGMLIALKRDEGASWSAGIVKRLSVDEQGNRYVGLEMLARGGAAVMVRAPMRSGGQIGRYGEELCVLLPASKLNTQRATLLMRANRFSSAEKLLMRLHDKSYLLSPLTLITRGRDFEIASFEIVGRQQSMHAPVAKAPLSAHASVHLG